MKPGLLLAILILASAVSWMSTDLYAPSLAHLPGYFGTDAATVKLTMSLNILAYGLATLVYGPLSERFGRRPVLLWGLAGFTLFSLACALAQTIAGLIAARIFQGLTAAVEGVVVLAIIRDSFDAKGQVRAYAIFGVATALVPAVAPVIGAWIYIYFGWRMNFYLLTAIAAVTTLLVWFHLRESTTRDVTALRPAEIIGDYLSVLSNANFLRYTLIEGSMLGCFFAFITAGPFILIIRHGLPTEYFGYFQGLLVVFFIAGSIIAGKLSHRMDRRRILKLGVAGGVAGIVMLNLVVFGGVETPATLALALALLAFGDGPIFATTPSLAMDATDTRTGAAAAMLLAIQMGMASLAALAVGVFHDGTTRPLAITCAALGTVIVLCSIRRSRGSPGNSD